MSKLYFFVLLVVSAHARVTTNEHEVLDNVLNEIPKDTKLQASDVHPKAQIIIDNSNIKSFKIDAKVYLENNNKTNIKGTKETCINTTIAEEILNNTIDPDQEPCVPVIKEDNGTALILTKYIEEGRINEARNASRVDSKLFLGVESYSGFLTVNKTYNSNLFFWYFPVLNKPANDTPWIIWLQGGPGASSMTGLFDEIGPFKIIFNDNLIWNKHTWLQNHSLVFIDNPVGTGFSFTEHKNGFTTDMDTYGIHLYTAVKQLVQIFPELRVAPLYVAGESYAGKFIPALGIEIFKHKDIPGVDINLKGLIMGNAYIDPAMISRLTHPFYYFGLLEKEQIELIKPLLEAFQQDIAENRSVAAKNKWKSLIVILLLLTHQKHAYNFLSDDLTMGKFMTFLTKSEVKRALHVGDIKFSFLNITVNSQLSPDFLSSSKPLVETLLEHYKILAYCGQLDQMLPCVFTSENYRTWKWNGSDKFLESTRYPFFYNKKLTGYHKSGGNLTEVIVRGAGHMVPMDVPGPAQTLIARWTHGEPIGPRIRLLEGTFIQEFVKNNSITLYF